MTSPTMASSYEMRQQSKVCSGVETTSRTLVTKLENLLKDKEFLETATASPGIHAVSQDSINEITRKYGTDSSLSCLQQIQEQIKTTIDEAKTIHDENTGTLSRTKTTTTIAESIINQGKVRRPPTKTLQQLKKALIRAEETNDELNKVMKKAEETLSVHEMDVDTAPVAAHEQTPKMDVAIERAIQEHIQDDHTDIDGLKRSMAQIIQIDPEEADIAEKQLERLDTSSASGFISSLTQMGTLPRFAASVTTVAPFVHRYDMGGLIRICLIPYFALTEEGGTYRGAVLAALGGFVKALKDNPIASTGIGAVLFLTTSPNWDTAQWATFGAALTASATLLGPTPLALHAATILTNISGFRVVRTAAKTSASATVTKLRAGGAFLKKTSQGIVKRGMERKRTWTPLRQTNIAKRTVSFFQALANELGPEGPTSPMETV